MADTPILPEHVAQTIQAITELHRQHHLRATPSQKVVAQMIAVVGRPSFVGALTAFLAIWIGLNASLHLAGFRVLDPPPFSYVQVLSGVTGVYFTVMILIAQRRENQLSEARDQLTLELAILSEQKSAKIIALLEELRRDLPAVPDRVDLEAEQLSQRADPKAVADALRGTTGDVAADAAAPKATRP